MERMEKDFEIAAKAIRDKNWKQLTEIEERNRDSFIHAVFAWAGLKDLWLLKTLKAFDADEKYTFATTHFPTLIIGETGTSKEFMSKAIHMMSKRRGGPFSVIDCSTVPSNLLDSDLFGHEKGAFTGATQPRKGMFEATNKGTIFLDELGKVEKGLQPKLLRVIEYGEIRPLGSNKTKRIDVRVIAAIQPAEVKNIIPDLRSRFSNYIHMPSLKERLYKAGKYSLIIIAISFDRLLKKTQDQSMESVSLPKNWLRRDTRDTWMELSVRDYKTNYRELEDILMKAIVSAKNKGRKIVGIDDLKEATTKYERFLRYTKPEYSVALKDIELKDLFKYADMRKAIFVEEKIKSEMRRTGLDLKSLCEREGIEYHNFRKKVVTLTGKGIKEVTASVE